MKIDSEQYKIAKDSVIKVEKEIAVWRKLKVKKAIGNVIVIR